MLIVSNEGTDKYTLEMTHSEMMLLKNALRTSVITLNREIKLYNGVEAIVKSSIEQKKVFQEILDAMEMAQLGHIFRNAAKYKTLIEQNKMLN